MTPDFALRCADAPEVAIALATQNTMPRLILDLLPRSGTILHSRRSGCELFLAVPGQLHPGWDEANDGRALEPGDVFASSCPPYYRDAPPPEVVDSSQGYVHVGIAYDTGVRFATPAGFEHPCVIGEVVSSLAELEALGESIRLAGARRFALIRRNEES